MSAMWIKICGITRREDAQLAVHLGVNALGFVMHSHSPRRCEADAARDMIRELPEMVHGVGVWFDEPVDAIAPIAERIGCSWVQTYDLNAALALHSRGFAILPAITLPIASALRTRAGWRGVEADRVIVDLGRANDGRRVESPGSAAHAHDTHGSWRVLRAINLAPTTRLILAGGLNDECVGAALDKLRPDGVDAASGLESAPGIKDHGKMIQFVEEVRGWKEKAISAPTAVDSCPRR